MGGVISSFRMKASLMGDLYVDGGLLLLRDFFHHGLQLTIKGNKKGHHFVVQCFV